MVGVADGVSVCDALCPELGGAVRVSFAEGADVHAATPDSVAAIEKSAPVRMLSTVPVGVQPARR